MAWQASILHPIHLLLIRENSPSTKPVTGAAMMKIKTQAMNLKRVLLKLVLEDPEVALLDLKTNQNHPFLSLATALTPCAAMSWKLLAELI